MEDAAELLLDNSTASPVIAPDLVADYFNELIRSFDVLLHKEYQPEEYKAEQEAFVTGHNGTSHWEVSLVSSVGPLSILLRNFAIPWLFPMKKFYGRSRKDFWLKLLLDFIFSILPCQMAVVGWPESVGVIVSILIGLIISLAFFCFCEYFYSDRVSPQTQEVLEYQIHPTSQRASITNGNRFNRQYLFLSYFRTYANIATALCILGVDFKSFPRRFSKTETYGYSIMDVGVGVIVIANGLVSSEIKAGNKRIRLRDVPRNLAQSAPLFVLGFIRLASVKLSGYQEHVSEYGVHWNFFFTIASIKAFTSLIACLISVPSWSWFLSIVLISGYQYSLENMGLRAMIIGDGNDHAERMNLFDANREGLCSLIGYLALYYAGVTLGVWIFQTKTIIKDYWKLWCKLLLLSLVFGVLLHFAHIHIEPPSRRMVNATYYIWMLYVTLKLLLMYLSVELIALFMVAVKMPLYHTGRDNELFHPLHVVEPCLWEAINYNMLAFFLFANALTGCVNMGLRTLYASHAVANIIMLMYTLFISGRDNELFHPLHVVEPCLWEAINYNMLAFFLFANALTGCVNMGLRTLYASHAVANIIMLMYTLFISGRDNELFHPLHVVEPCLWEAINYNMLAFFLFANALTGCVNMGLRTLYASHAVANIIMLMYTLYFRKGQ